MLSNQSGSVLVLIMIFFLVFTIIGIGYLSLAALEGRVSQAQVQRMQAFIRAENALNIGLWRINHGSDQEGTFDYDSLAADYDSSLLVLKGYGTSGNHTCSLAVQLFKDHPFNHIVAYQSNLDTSNYTLSHLPDHQVARFDVLPSIISILNYYYTIADYYYEGNKSFDGTMAPGIYYVNGNVTMKNGTYLNGTLVVTGDVKFIGHVTINAQKDPEDTTLYFPALIAGDTAKTESDILGDPLLVINGAVYSTGAVVFKGKQISGPIVASKVELKSGVTISDQGNSCYYRFPRGFGDPADFSWHKLILKGSWQRLGG